MSARIHLEVLDVKEPCTEDWNRMVGDERTRFCRTCLNDVHDLSAMTREDAEALLRRTEGRLCVRFYRRADGTVSTLDCAPHRLAAARRHARRALAFAGAMVASAFTLALGFGFTTERTSEQTLVGKWATRVLEPEPMLMGAPRAYPEPLMGEAMPADLPPSPPPTDGEPALDSPRMHMGAPIGRTN